MQSGEKEGETGLARQGRGKSPRATEGARLRSGALFALSLGLQEKPQNPRRSFQNTAGSLVDSGPAQGQSVYWIVVEKPAAGAGSGAGTTPGSVGVPISCPQGPGVKAGLYAVGPCESVPPVGGTLHRPERDMGLLRVDMPL